MRDLPFVKTVAGRELLEKQLPEFIRELKKLRRATERVADALERHAPSSAEPKEDQE